MDTTSRIDAGLSHPLARLVLLFSLLVLLISAGVGGVVPEMAEWSAALWFAVAALITSYTAVTVRRPGRLSPVQLALVVLPGLAAAAVLFWQGSDAVFVYALGFLSLGVSLPILRGHTIVGTVSSGIVIAMLLLRTLATGIHFPHLAEQIVQPVLMLIACWVLFAVSRSIATGRAKAVAEQLRAVVVADSLLIGSVEQRRAMHEIPEIAAPLLRRIAAGEPMTDELQAEIAAADEEVRNLIRLELPHHEGLLRAVSDARRRGARVRLIGSEGPASTRISDALAERLIALLETDGLVSATARFLPRSRGGAVSLLVEREDGAQRHEFELDGTPIRREGRAG